MSSNGKRRPQRPSITVVAPSAAPDEAAAIAAALERFLYDTAPVIAPSEQTMSAWERAAIVEGVGLAPPDPWGDPEPWG